MRFVLCADPFRSAFDAPARDPYAAAAHRMTAWQEGTLFAVGTALSWTLSALAFESASRRVGSLVVNLVRLVIAFGFLVLWNWYARDLPWPSDASREAWLYLSLSGFLGFFIGDMALFRAFVVMGARRRDLAIGCEWWRPGLTWASKAR